ncbi:MAG TPA: hypothetical protein VEF04_07860 [Blastocatellia bacterium]|nr:hypothetical protein [Blastocatellia bacterium]
MNKNIIKFSVATIVMSFIVLASVQTTAYPPFTRQAAKFGAKDCTFCHTNAAGGEGWNERGNWLIAEKDRRKADSIDVEWLAEYKEGATATGDAATGEAKSGEKSGETKTEEKKSDETKSDEKHENHDEKKNEEKKDTKPPVR